jgi:hypothetical protein
MASLQTGAQYRKKSLVDTVGIWPSYFLKLFLQVSLLNGMEVGQP